MRNSSLVKRSCAENVPGLKYTTETRDFRRKFGVVGERSICGEGELARFVGADGSANAGMSSEKYVRTIFAENLRFPTEGQSASG